MQQSANLQQSNSSIVASDVCISKPKYYKVGDIEIKDDNGKIY